MTKKKTTKEKDTTAAPELVGIKGFKGFGKDLKCRDFQFEFNKEFEMEGKPQACKNGFHFCEHPLHVFSYYPPGKSRYAEVEGFGEAARHHEDSKVAVTKIKIGAEITLKKLIESSIAFTFSKVKWSKENTTEGAYSGATANGNYSGATANGNYSGATANGNYSGATAIGYKAKARGEAGSWISISECVINSKTNRAEIVDMKTFYVDGKEVLENVYYILEGGKLAKA